MRFYWTKQQQQKMFHLIFRCLQYMADFNSCLLQNFGVLAGPPSRVIPLLESTTYAIISWQPPKILPDTVTEYHVYLRKLGSGTEYTVMEKERQPIIIQDLEPGTRYEVFVVSLNAHGKGGPSPRLVLQTKQMVNMFIYCRTPIPKKFEISKKQRHENDCSVQFYFIFHFSSLIFSVLSIIFCFFLCSYISFCHFASWKKKIPDWWYSNDSNFILQYDRMLFTKQNITTMYAIMYTWHEIVGFGKSLWNLPATIGYVHSFSFTFWVVNILYMYCNCVTYITNTICNEINVCFAWACALY